MRILYFSRSYTTDDRRYRVELAASPVDIREVAPLEEGESPVSPERWIRLAPRLQAVLEEVRLELAGLAPRRRSAIAVRRRATIERKSDWKRNIAKLLVAGQRTAAGSGMRNPA